MINFRQEFHEPIYIFSSAQKKKKRKPLKKSLPLPEDLNLRIHGSQRQSDIVNQSGNQFRAVIDKTGIYLHQFRTGLHFFTGC